MPPRRTFARSPLLLEPPADFAAESLFFERRATMRLERVDGRTAPPVHLYEIGCRLGGLVGDRPFSFVFDDPDTGVLRRASGTLAGALASPPMVSGAGLHEKIQRLAPRVLAAFEAWEGEAAAAAAGRGVSVSGIACSALLSRGIVTAARARPDGPFLGARDERSALEGRVTVALRSESREISVEASRWADMSIDDGTGSPMGWEGAATEAVERALDLLESVPPPAMESPVVFSPDAAGVLLHEIAGHLLEGDLAASGATPFTGRAGTCVAPASLTLVDNPRAPGGRVRHLVDDEGEPTRANILIESGVLSGFLTDHATAHLSAGVSTGNGRRESYRFGVLPRMTNLAVAAGPDHPDDMLKRLPRALYVSRLGRGQVDPRRGEFRLEVESGRLIESGRMGRGVAGAFLVGSCAELLSSIDAVGSDLHTDASAGLCIKEDQIVPVGQSAPSLRVTRLKVLPGVAP